MNKLAVFSIAALSLVSCGDDNAVAATAKKGDAFCKLAQTAHDDNQALNDMTDADLADKAKVKLQLTAAIDSLTAMVAKAPKDIAVTAKKQLDVELAVEKLLKDSDYDVIKAVSSDAGKKVFEDSQSSQADDDLKAYLDDKCGIAPPDTTPDTTAPEDTASADTVTGDAIDLGEGDEAINKFLDLYEIGTNSTLTPDERSCVVSELSGKVTGAELTEAMNAEASDAVQQAVGLAFIKCNIAVQS